MKATRKAVQVDNPETALTSQPNAEKEAAKESVIDEVIKNREAIQELTKAISDLVKLENKRHEDMQLRLRAGKF